MPKSVLIVDDEQLLVRTLSNVLRESGYRIATAGSAEEADKRAFADPSFDLIVLDNRLPGESGIGMIKRLLRRGFIFLPEGEHANVISWTPPLTISPAQLRSSVDAVRKEIAAL